MLYISIIQLAARGPNSAHEAVSTGPRVDKKRRFTRPRLNFTFKCYTGVTKSGNLGADTPSL
jgi:hypothetical protein